MCMVFKSFPRVGIFVFTENKRFTCFCLLLTFLRFVLRVQDYSASYDGIIQVGMYVWVAIKS